MGPKAQQKPATEFKFKEGWTVFYVSSYNSLNSFFIIGERVLCFHGPLLYEAKNLKAEVKDQQNKYLIHYAGWNKKYDGKRTKQYSNIC